LVRSRPATPGRVKVKRFIKDVLVDPSTQKVVIVNALSIENLSEKPLYEVIYRESSPYVPLKGTVYLNGAPYGNPSVSEEEFSYRIPLIPPKETFTLSWNSKLPRTSKAASATVAFSYRPFEELDNKYPVKVPILIKASKPKVYELTVYFDFAEYKLSQEAKDSLKKLATYLRKSGYRWIYLKVVGHTDSVKVRPDAKKHKSNLELSLKRAQAVKNYLKSLLIDVKKVQVRR